MPREFRFKSMCFVAVANALNPTVLRWEARKVSYRSGALTIKAAKPNGFIGIVAIVRRRSRDSPAGDYLRAVLKYRH